MAIQQIQKYSDILNLQMAAEAFWLEILLRSRSGSDQCNSLS
jgi:hypothetical protein